jgi:transposase
MSDAVGLSTDRRFRRFRSISEKLQIVQLTLKPGASVAQVAQAHGVNANQVFKWRRAFDRGELSEPSVALVPVTVGSPRPASGEIEGAASPATGAIHIELPGRATISVESGADSSLVRSILESLRK